MDKVDHGSPSNDAAPIKTDTSTIANNAVRGVVWTGGGQVVLQLIQVGTSVALARLLAPEMFGLIGMAMVFIGIAQLLADFGLGSAIVQARQIEPLVLSSAFWANAGIGLVLMLAVASLAPVFAALYGHPEIANVIMALSVSLFFAALNAVPSAVLYKAMNFAALAKTRLAATAITSIAVISLAAFGFGVWSLVAQPIVGSVLNLALTWSFARWRPRFVFALSSLKGMIGYSSAVLGNSVLYYFSRNTDSFLIGKYVGSEPLGYYAMANQLMLYPLTQVSSVIIRVLFPTLAQLQDELHHFRLAYLKSVSVITFITFPMMLGLIAISHDFIVVVFGEKWLPMENVVRILAVVGMVQSATTGVSTILLSTGRTRTMFVLSVCGFLLSAASYVVGLRWGIEGVAGAYAVALLLSTEAYMAYIYRFVGLRLIDFHKALMRPLLAAAVMFVVVLAANNALDISSINPALRLFLCVTVGVCVYGAVSFVVNRAELVSTYALLRRALGGSNK